ncbi:iron-containing alcohol dehydrogenase [Thermodesulfobacteriota bacterium]
MENFVLENRTKIIFGRDTIKQVGQETALLGSRVLLVYGRGSCMQNGIYHQVQDALLKGGVTVIELGGIRANPVLEQVREGVNLARREKVEAVLAVGGGSVIDSAKAICAGVPVEHDVWQFFRGKKGIGATLPLACVLTIAGSGSEMNGGMVLTNQESVRKMGIGNKRLQPAVSILDPVATFTVPPDQTAYGAVDTVAHLLEFYCTTEARQTPLQDRFMEGVAQTVIAACEKALAEPEDYDTRADLMWSATLALNGWSAAGLGRVGFPMHMIEHSLSALYGVPHGAGLAVVIPAWLSWRAEQAPERIARFAERVFGIPAGDNKDNARQGISHLLAWFRRVGCPTSLAELGVSAAEIPRIAENALPQAKLWRLREYTQPVIEEILHRC